MVRQYVDDRFDSAVPPVRRGTARVPRAAIRTGSCGSGRQLSFEDALAEVTAAVQQERRAQAVSAWMDRLRRRAEIREVYRSCDAQDVNHRARMIGRRHDDRDRRVRAMIGA